MKTVVTYSAGGVVLRDAENGIEVLLGGDAERNTWGLPKGGPSKGESVEQTAVRETAEETGLEVRVLAPVSSIDYWFVAAGKRFHKSVHYFLMRPVGGDISRHDAEYDQVKWFPLDAAYLTMTYANEVAIVQKAVVLWISLQSTRDSDDGTA